MKRTLILAALAAATLAMAAPVAAVDYPYQIAPLPDTSPTTKECSISPAYTYSMLAGRPAGEWQVNSTLSLVWTGTQVTKAHRRLTTTGAIRTTIFSPPCPPA